MQEVETGHTVVKSKGPSEGKFTFTSHDAGDHSICLSTNYTSWFSSTHIRLYLDIVVGTTRPDTEHDRTHVSEIAAKVRDLNQKLEDIRREQQYQREREADYRDLSEMTNSRAVWYSVVQIVVLIVTCVWQLRHLKVYLRPFPPFSFSDWNIYRTFLRIGNRDSIMLNVSDCFIFMSFNAAYPHYEERVANVLWSSTSEATIVRSDNGKITISPQVYTRQS